MVKFRYKKVFGRATVLIAVLCVTALLPITVFSDNPAAQEDPLPELVESVSLDIPILFDLEAADAGESRENEDPPDSELTGTEAQESIEQAASTGENRQSSGAESGTKEAESDLATNLNEAENANPYLQTVKEESAAEGLSVDAKSAVLIDADSGTVIFEQNSHEQLPPASVTKVMTMLLALEAIDRGQIAFTDEVTISPRAASMGGSQMFMEAGETQTVETLLKGMAIASANDACVAIAEYVAGTEEIFVENMNKRAAELGMTDTNFVNTNGLPVANHYTSAYDIGLMSKELLKFPETKEWFNTWQTTVTVGLPGKETELELTNTNRLIRQYPGANGIKTGFTQDAMYCLSGSATKDDLTLIAVIMGSPTSQIRFSEAGRLLDYGFATYDSVKLAEKGDVLDVLPIEKGSPQSVCAVAGETINTLVKKGEGDSISTAIELYGNMAAPIAKGEVIGQLSILKDGEEVARYSLYAESDVEKAGFLELYIRMLKTLV